MNETHEGTESPSKVKGIETRAYTVEEIDNLRDACENRWLFGSTRFSDRTQMSRQYQGFEKDVAVEALVRTHMLAGHTASDLFAADRPPSQVPNESNSCETPRVSNPNKS